MYSSVSDAEYQFRRSRAEEDARNAYDRSARSPKSSAEPEAPAAVQASSGGTLPSLFKEGTGGFLSRIRQDDILLLGILFLLLNENKEDDPLMLIILAVLFLN